MTNTVKVQILGALILAWIAIVAVQFLTEPEPQRVPLQNQSGPASRVGQKDVSPMRTKLLHPMLAKVESEDIPATPSKNIFAPLEFPKPKTRRVAKAKPAPSPVSSRVTPTIPSPPSAEELAAQRARMAMAQYRFLGYVQEGGEPRAFLVKGQDIFIIGAGETLEGEIRVAGIQPTSVELRFADTNIRTILPLVKSGNQQGGNALLIF